MNTHADKPQENKSQSVANSLSQKQSRVTSAFQFVDSRPEAIAQRKLQAMVNDYVKQKSVIQLNSDETKKREVSAKMILHHDRGAYHGRTGDMKATEYFGSTLRVSDQSRDIAYLDEQKRLKVQEQKDVITEIKNGTGKINVIDENFHVPNIDGKSEITLSFKNIIIKHLTTLSKTSLGLEMLHDLQSLEHPVTIVLSKSATKRGGTLTRSQYKSLRELIPKRKLINNEITKNEKKVQMLSVFLEENTDQEKEKELQWLKEKVKKLKQSKDEINSQIKEADTSADQEKIDAKNPAKGTGSYIEIDPTNDSYETKTSGTEPWMSERVRYGLYHEMIHAYHKGKGTETSGSNAGEQNTEWQAVGLGDYKNEKYSENSIRKAMGKALRPHYGDKVPEKSKE